jgi:hypothetical protein
MLLVPEDSLRNRWVNFEIHVQWSTRDSGFFRVYVDGVQKVDYWGPTYYSGEPYLKYGVYRSFVSRYTGSRLPGQVALFANVRAAQNREGLKPPAGLKR